MLFVNQNCEVTHDGGTIVVQFGQHKLNLTLVEASWLAANIQREIRAVELTDEERRLLRVGDVVIVRDDAGLEAEYRVKAEPWQLPNGRWVIGLAGISGGYLLDRVVRVVRYAERGEACS